MFSAIRNTAQSLLKRDSRRTRRQAARAKMMSGRESVLASNGRASLSLPRRVGMIGYVLAEIHVLLDGGWTRVDAPQLALKPSS